MKLHSIGPQKDYQEYNKALATAISRSIGMTDTSITKGLSRAKLQCRFETVQEKPLVILDGAHNRAKMATTVENVLALKSANKYKHLFLIVGMADNKDHFTILKQIAPLADRIWVTRSQVKDRKCAHPTDLAKIAKRYVRAASVKIDMSLDGYTALSNAIKMAKKDDLVLVTGSFFLSGELRKHWFPEDKILTERKTSFY